MNRMFSRKSNKVNAILQANEEKDSGGVSSLALLGSADDCSWRIKKSLPLQLASKDAATSESSKSSNNEMLKLGIRDGDIKIKEIDREKESDTKRDSEILKEIAILESAGNLLLGKGDLARAFLKLERALKLKVNHPMFEKAARGLEDSNGSYCESHKVRMLASYASSLNNDTYLKQKAGEQSVEESMMTYLQALEMKQVILGPSHPSIAITLTNIGSVFVRTKDFRPALKAYNRAYKIMLARFGPDHLDVSTILSNIADVYAKTKQHEKALVFYRHALSIRWRLCPFDPKVVKIMERIASLETGSQGVVDDDFSDGDFEEDGQQHDQGQSNGSNGELNISLESIERDMALEIRALETSFFRSHNDNVHALG